MILRVGYKRYIKFVNVNSAIAGKTKKSLMIQTANFEGGNYFIFRNNENSKIIEKLKQ